MHAPLAARVHLTYAGSKHTLEYNPGVCSTVGDLVASVGELFGLATETIKLLPKLPQGASAIHLVRDAAQTLQEAGITSGAAFLVVGSKAEDVASVLSAKDLPGLASFEHEDRVAAARRSRAMPGHHSQRRHRFGPIEPWQRPGLSPPPSAAAALLLRLASDPAIVAVMDAHGWRVGCLTEMPPEGKVGVSAVCILGYNVNQGQEISLRLRTDDLKGFRKYLKIRETLVHELAHMVYSEHDDNFKMLNSQLLREVAAHEAATTVGGQVLGAAGATKHWLGDDGDEEEDPQVVLPAVMVASAASSGKTLRQLAGPAADAAAGPGTRSASPQQLAAEAASRRWQHHAEPVDITRTSHTSGLTPSGMPRTPSPVPGSVTGAPAAHGVPVVSPDGSPGGKGGVWQEVEAAMQHEDAATSRAEAAMQQLEDATLPRQPAGGVQGASPPEFDMADAAGGVRAAHHPAVSMAAEAAAAEVMLSAASITCAADTTTTAHGHSAAPQKQQQQNQQQPAPVLPGSQQGQPQQQQQQVYVNGLEPQGAAVASSSQPDMDMDLPEGALDEVTARKLQQVRAALVQLSTTLPAQEAAAVKQTLQDILGRLLAHPEEPKHGRLRMGNAAFHRKVGQHRPAVEVLLVAGFVVKEHPVVGDTGAPEQVLCYTRRDPGLLWMVKSALA